MMLHWGCPSAIETIAPLCVVEQVTAVDAAELWFVGVRVTVSDTDLAWLYNLITNLAAGPIQDAITREVASQVGYASPVKQL